MLLPPSVKVWLASEPVDLRRSHDGLSALVRTRWQKAPYSRHVFVFVGRRRGMGPAPTRRHAF